MINQAKGTISAENIIKFYGEKLVLDRISFTVQQGNCLALLGSSGSGKSTILRIIASLETVDDGTIIIEGHDISDPRISVKPINTIGMIFQSYNLFPHLTALSNITLALKKVRGLSRTDAKERACHFLNRVGMADFYAQYPDRLSGGQRQRVAIARALALEPTILLCDEITAALDPKLSGEILDLIASLIEDGLTVIMSTHEIGFAKTIASNVHLLEQGKTIYTATTADFFSSSANQQVHEFLSATKRFI